MALLSYLGLFTNFIPAALGLFHWNHLPQVVRWFTIMCLIIAINGLLGFLGEHLIKNNMPLFHFYLLVEGCFLIVIFSRLLMDFVHPFLKPVALMVYASYWLANVFFADGILGYPTTILAVEALLLMGLASSWFFKVLKQRKLSNPAQTFGFWLSTGVLIFFSGNLLLFIFSNYIFSMEPHVFRAIWDIHALLVLIIHIHYIIAILWARKNPILS